MSIVGTSFSNGIRCFLSVGDVVIELFGHFCTSFNNLTCCFCCIDEIEVLVNTPSRGYNRALSCIIGAPTMRNEPRLSIYRTVYHYEELALLKILRPLLFTKGTPRVGYKYSY